MPLNVSEMIVVSVCRKKSEQKEDGVYVDVAVAGLSKLLDLNGF